MIYGDNSTMMHGDDDQEVVGIVPGEYVHAGGLGVG